MGAWNLRQKNCYDVTILINGLPLVQIELKRRGTELKQAYNQIQRYHKTSFHGLFDYIQLFVISNGVNTRYFANNPNIQIKHDKSMESDVFHCKSSHFLQHYMASLGVTTKICYICSKYCNVIHC